MPSPNPDLYGASSRVRSQLTALVVVLYERMGFEDKTIGPLRKAG